MEKGILLPALYLGPLEYFSKIKNQTTGIVIEKFEHFPKQTYRNRTSIHSPNGKLDLTIPVKKGSNLHTLMKDVRISYDADWQRLHWRGLQTSYRSSSFFEFYEDDFAPFFHNKTEFLFDFNVELMELCLKLLKINTEIKYTAEYIEKPDLEDLRASIHPKKKLQQFLPKPYFQIFEERNGFIPNLSIIDLLFNQGPQSRQFL